MAEGFNHLTAHFFKGTLKGQINSLWKTRKNVERIDEYKQALAKGLVKLDQPLNRGQVKRLEEMNITVPENLKPVKKEKAPRQKKEKVSRDPNEVRLSYKQVDALAKYGITCPKELAPINARRTSKVVAVPVETTSAPVAQKEDNGGDDTGLSAIAVP